jgi:hypothetical protein
VLSAVTTFASNDLPKGRKRRKHIASRISCSLQGTFRNRANASCTVISSIGGDLQLLTDCEMVGLAGLHDGDTIVPDASKV